MLQRMDEATWTLSELAEEVAAGLRGYEGAANGQVRAVPDERSIRYYTTLGLLDRPAAMRGRTALYGKRHLAQVVAIKRLQSAGKPLSEIATIVPTLDDATLARVSGVVVPRRAAPAAGRADFWRSRPAAPSAPPASAPHSPAPAAAPIARAPLPAVRLYGRSRDQEKAKAAARRGFGKRFVLELAPGVTIALDPEREANDADADAVLNAARPLLAELRRRHLISVEAYAATIESTDPGTEGT